MLSSVVSPTLLNFLWSKKCCTRSRFHTQIPLSEREVAYLGARAMPRLVKEYLRHYTSVLHSDRAIQVNIAIMRAFVKLREIFSTHKELVAPCAMALKALALKLKQLEMKLEKQDEEIRAIFEAIAELMAPPPEKPDL